tara:strand:- start:967 stop:1146 length:180 start_codon:yes stop_codon:yes gene_type:complete
MILAVIYINALFVLFSKGFNKAELNIDKNLQLISKIPKIKNKFTFIKDNIPFFMRSFFN